MRDSAGVSFPPPFIYAIAFLLGLLVAHYVPLGGVAPLWVRVLGAALVVAGVALAATAFRIMLGAGNKIAPNLPVNVIVTRGPYRFTRNPMYVALSLTYLGFALFFSAWWAAIFLIAVIAIIRYAVIAREEGYLEQKFGKQYLSYKERVRRWL
jgi:protein-S-isoprenylcysteine O-methyltransferase Ste14